MSHFDSLKARIIVEEHQLSNVTTSHPDDSLVLNVDYFKENFKMNILHLDKTKIEFELINVDVSFVNALRRILLTEVPTMAFDKIMMYNNTSVVADEILALRLGLTPIAVDPRMFTFRAADSEPSEEDTLQFKLHVKCEKAVKGEANYLEVTTGHLEWVPLGNQADTFSGNEPQPVDKQITLTELNPGQELELVGQCYKSIGADHAKFQPVCLALYKPMPGIKLTRRVTGEEARRLQSCFSKGVIEIDMENGTYRKTYTYLAECKKREDDCSGEEVARVANPRLDTVSRNIFRYNDLRDAVDLSLAKNHYIFTVESVGCLPPETLVSEAIKVLVTKSQKLQMELDNIDDEES